MSKIYHYLTLSLLFLLSNSFCVAITINFNFIQEDIIASVIPHNIDSLKIELKKATRNNDSQAEGIVRRKLGEVYFNLGNLQEALEYYISSKLIFEQLNNPLETALTYEKLAVVYMFIAEQEKQYDLILRAIKIYEKTNDSIALARSYNNLAAGEKFRNAENTLTYLQQATKYIKNFDDEITQAEININYGTYFLRLNQNDSAYIYLKKALPIVQKHQLNAKECETFIKLGRAVIFISKDSSTYFFNEAYRKSLLYKNYLWTGRSLIYLANIDFNNGNKKNAFQKIHEALNY